MKIPRMQNFLEGGLSSRPPISTRVFEFRPVRPDHKQFVDFFLLRRYSGGVEPRAKAHVMAIPSRADAV